MSRILRVGPNSTDDGDDDGEIDGETELLDEDSGGLLEDDYIDHSRDVPLQFQERSLRQYFREVDANKVGLKYHPQEAHLTVFVMAVQILVSAKNDSASEEEKTSFKSLRCSYATHYWVQHFLEIEVQKVSDIDAGSVIESLHTIFRLPSEVLKLMATATSPGTIFGCEIDTLFDSITLWSQRASRLPGNILSNDVRQFMSNFIATKNTFLLHLAKCHVQNWLRATGRYSTVKNYYEHAAATFKLMVGSSIALAFLHQLINLSESDIRATKRHTKGLSRYSNDFKCVSSYWHGDLRRER